METTISIPVDENGNTPTKEEIERLAKAEAIERLVKAEAKQAFTKERRDKADKLMFEALDNLVQVPYILPGFIQDADERKSLYQEIHAAEELVRELWHRVQKAR